MGLKSAPEFLASYFTLAGDVFPFGPSEVSPIPFRARAEVAGRAGFSGMGLILADVQATASRIGLADMRRIADDNGIRHIELEFLSDWFRTGAARQRSDAMRREILTSAEALGARHIKVAPGLGADIARPTAAELVPQVAVMAEAFHGVAEDAQNVGCGAVLEIMPFSNVRTIEVGRAIVEGAGHANGSLLIDLWHLARGNVPLAQIRDIPAQYIGAVELDDARTEIRGSLWEDTVRHRELPGEGDLDQRSFIGSVVAAGYSGPWGVEILSETFRRLPLEVMAERAFATASAQVAQWG